MRGTKFRLRPGHISILGAALTILVGLMLYIMPAGDAWTNASFDYLFRFGSHPVTNKVALILMDNASFDQFGQQRNSPWDRGLHAQLLNRLADDGCEMVVMDSFFRKAANPETDRALADAIRRQRHVVLMAEQSKITHPDLDGVQPDLPLDVFLDAATNWGVAWLDPDLDAIVRRHWPFPSPGPQMSLPWSSALALGVKPDPDPQRRWLRYYGRNGAVMRMSYEIARIRPAGFFRDYIVFIGSEPRTTVPDYEVDEFSTPYTRWTGESVGGVEILATQFLNLLNNEALLRPRGWIEILIFCLTGSILGAGFFRLKRMTLIGAGSVVFIFVPLLAVLLSYFSNYWFPWFIVSGAQLPCAMACAVVGQVYFKRKDLVIPLKEPLPDTPGYKLIQPAFGSGAYGKVWLARNRAGQWRALKAIYLSHFKGHTAPYDREYEGIEKYMHLSGQHPGLLHVDYISPKGSEYFYYVMELGDSVVSDWESTPARYKPRDLENELAQSPEHKLRIGGCIRIGIELCDVLGFIHSQGLTHRDIKPQNIIFVNGRPKLADLGLITDIRPADEEGTLVGTTGFIPPPPDHPGTVSADIYALGIVLYVLCTGRNAAQFPELATAITSEENPEYFMALNNIILTACEPLPMHRYASAELMRTALEKLQAQLFGTASKS